MPKPTAIIYCILIFFIAACTSTSAPITVDDRRLSPDNGKTSYSSAEELDQFVIDFSTKAWGPASQHNAISGRNIIMLKKFADVVSSDWPDKCGNAFLENHLFFYKSDGEDFNLVAAPRYVIDESNQPYDNTDIGGGFYIPLIAGARLAGKCAVHYKYSVLNDSFEFIDVLEEF